MNRYKLVSNTGKRLVCQTFNDAARIQKKLAGRGIKTTVLIQRGASGKPEHHNPQPGAPPMSKLEKILFTAATFYLAAHVVVYFVSH